MKRITLLVLSALSLCACDKVYDSAYYQANCKKAEQVLEKCKSGETSGDNCKNADHGFNRYKAQAFEDYMLGKTKIRPNGTCQ